MCPHAGSMPITVGKIHAAHQRPVVIDASRLHTTVCVTIVCVQVDRLSVTMDPELGRAVRHAAARSGLSVSRWLGNAAADHLRNQLLGAALDVWEAEAGAFTDAELAVAARTLTRRVPARRRAKAS